MQVSSNALIGRKVRKMGTCYKGGADHYHKVTENIGSLATTYKYYDGLFGDRGQGGSSVIRNIASDDPQATAKDFFDRLTYGGIEKTLYYKDGTEKGKRVTMADGSTMNWRKVSSSADKSPAVDIDIERSNDHGELVTQKIHFTKR